MCTLVLMRVQSFNIVCTLVFHNLYIVHTMKYIFLNYLVYLRLMAVPCIPNGHHTQVEDDTEILIRYNV